MSRKGISLPVNMLVILAIAIVVLLALVSFFMGAFSGQKSQFTEQQKYNACCSAYVRSGCCDNATCTMDNTIGDIYTTIDGQPATVLCGKIIKTSNPDSGCGCQ